MKKIIQDALIGAGIIGATSLIWTAVMAGFTALCLWGVK